MSLASHILAAEHRLQRMLLASDAALGPVASLGHGLGVQQQQQDQVAAGDDPNAGLLVFQVVGCLRTPLPGALVELEVRTVSGSYQYDYGPTATNAQGWAAFPLHVHNEDQEVDYAITAPATPLGYQNRSFTPAATNIPAGATTATVLGAPRLAVTYLCISPCTRPIRRHTGTLSTPWGTVTLGFNGGSSYGFATQNAFGHRGSVRTGTGCTSISDGLFPISWDLGGAFQTNQLTLAYQVCTTGGATWPIILTGGGGSGTGRSISVGPASVSCGPPAVITYDFTGTLAATEVFQGASPVVTFTEP